MTMSFNSEPFKRLVDAKYFRSKILLKKKTMYLGSCCPVREWQESVRFESEAKVTELKEVEHETSKELKRTKSPP
jgi:hypothetical protein